MHVLKELTLLRRYLYITLGITLMVAGFYYFILPASMVIGGVSGVGVLFSELFDIKVSYVVFILNIILLGLGWLMLGRKSFFRSIYGSLLFPAILFIFETFSPPLDMPDDFLLYVTFGGFFLGLGFGIVIRFGGTSGGTDIPIKILHRLLDLPLSTSIYLVDGLIIFSGIVVFYSERGISLGLYAILTTIIAGKVSDYMVAGSNTLKAVHIITDHPERIKQLVFETIERGLSVIPIEGGYTEEEKHMLVSVITRDEYYTIRSIIAKEDPYAFVFASPATEIQGDFTKRWED
ncbi:MAG: YitT family protein [Bacillota bacterium]